MIFHDFDDFHVILQKKWWKIIRDDMWGVVSEEGFNLKTPKEGV